MDIVIGIGVSDWSPNVPRALKAAAEARGVAVREVDLVSLSTAIGLTDTRCVDRFGAVRVSHLAPTLLHLRPHAVLSYRALEQGGARPLNPVASVIAADDKGLTSLLLDEAGVAQVPTRIVPLEFEAMLDAFHSEGGACVFKRTHGGQGRWVRLARSEDDVRSALEYFRTEGPSAVLAQPVVEEALGSTVRVIVTGGRVLGATIRSASSDFRSNIALGSTQVATELSDEERALAIGATEALSLGHAGVDLLRTHSGPLVLEVNACPDFTSMTGLLTVDVAQVVIEQTLAATARD